MTKHHTELLLILKYGSLAGAAESWTREYVMNFQTRVEVLSNFSSDEIQVIDDYLAEKIYREYETNYKEG